MSFDVKMKRQERKGWKKIMLKNIFFIILFFVNYKLLIHLEELKVILQNIQNFFFCNIFMRV